MTALGQSGPAATPEHTAAFAARHGAAQHGGAAFYRQAWDRLTVASIGLGTYLGEPDAETDARYAGATRRYLQLGGNLLDTAINYRFQRSERVIGATLQAAIAAGEAARQGVVLCTKGGYLSFDGDWPADPDAWVRETLVDTGVVDPDEIVDGHCMTPGYLRHQIARSRENLQAECIDLYYLHNPESQLSAVGPDLFQERLREAFATFEVAFAQGHIGAYGVATWNGLRARPGAPDYLTLQRLVETARDVAGEQHHFRAVQLPLNFQMLEAVALQNQPGQSDLAPLLQVAAEHHIAVVGSASLLQGRVLGRLPERLRVKITPAQRLTDAQRALQFVRSTPGLTAALAGMSRAEHVDENLALASIIPMTADAWGSVFQV